MESSEGRDQITIDCEQKDTERSGEDEVHALSADDGVALDVLQLGYPGCKALREENIDITEVTDHIKMLAWCLIKTMYDEPGVGIAAPQVGANVNLIVVDAEYIVGGDRKPLIMINPVVIEWSRNEDIFPERCLSVPGIEVDVQRKTEIVVAFMDLNMDAQAIEVSEFEARVIQHEIDHLKGKLIIDYLSKLRKGMYIKSVFKSMRKAKKVQKRAKRYEDLVRASERRARRAGCGDVQPKLPECAEVEGASSEGDGAGDSIQVN